MCSPVPALPPLDFNSCMNDEDFITFLGGRKAGDQIPDNVLTDVDHVSIEPWHSPENIWYMYNSEDHHSLGTESGEIHVKVTENGYWRSTDVLRILTSTATTGTKITLEFYDGQAPFGKRTGWMMHEYHVEQKTGVVNKSQDYNSLCRFFLSQTNQPPIDKEEHISLAAAYDDRCSEQHVLQIAEQDKKNLFSLDATENPQTAALNEAKVKSDDGLCSEQRTDNSVGNREDLLNFSRDDYLELNDLLVPISPSRTSSSNSSSSINSDDYFNTDALLLDLGNQSNQSLEEERTDDRTNVSASVEANQPVLRPELDLNRSLCSSAVVAARSTHGDSVLDDLSGSCRIRSLPTDELRLGVAASRGNQASSAISESSRGSNKSPQSWPGGRLVKLRKYFCWGSF